MIRADICALEKEAKQRTIRIQEKEFKFLRDGLDVIATSSSLLAGVSFLNIIKWPFVDVNPWFLGPYFALQIMSMVLGLISSINAMLCHIFGQDLALHGTMEEAIYGMEIERTITFWYFKAANVFYVCAFAMWIWICSVGVAAIEISVISNVILGGFLIFFYRYNSSIQKRFKIRKNSRGLHFQKSIPIPMVLETEQTYKAQKRASARVSFNEHKSGQYNLA